MNQDDKKDIPAIFNTQNMRPARPKSVQEEKLIIDITNNLRPAELENRVIIPTPPQKKSRIVSLNEPTSDIPVGCFKFTNWMVLQLDIVGREESIRVSPKDNLPLVIGRNPESVDIPIDIDLTTLVSDDAGVSRVHAAIVLYGSRLEIEDRNSTNGTSINGIHFNANESYPLRSGDIISLGTFQMHVKFTERLKKQSNKKDTAILT